MCLILMLQVDHLQYMTDRGGGTQWTAILGIGNGVLEAIV